MKKVAVIGSGIGGLSAAYYLKKAGYHVSLYEGGSYFGGHTHTHTLNLEGETFNVDTGFLVHNDRTYPNLIKFFEELGIATHDSDMSFSVSKKDDKIEWCGSNIFTLFSQPKNLFSPRFYKFIKEILRFNSQSEKYITECESNLDFTLGDLLQKYRYSEDFQNWYLLPMGGCIWSTPVEQMKAFPAFTFLRFCINHGLLQISNRPQWRTVIGGCSTYVSRVTSLLDELYLKERVIGVTPVGDSVEVQSIGRSLTYDHVVMSAHPPQILEFLNIENDSIINLLKCFKYQKNDAVLHTDESVLPKSKFAWAAWNYLSNSKEGENYIGVNYLLNKLQEIPLDTPIITSLNLNNQIREEHIIKKMVYEHPIFDNSAIKAQQDLMYLQGYKNLYFSGAWLRYGFHEDGIWSGKKIVEKIIEHDRSECEVPLPV